MGRLSWYKRDPRAALEGMENLSIEESGAYSKVLDLIYIHDGHLPDDSTFICRRINCDARLWKRLRGQLIAKGKLYVEDGCLHNPRAAIEIAKALAKLDANAHLGRSGGLKTQQINKLAQASAKQILEDLEDSGDSRREEPIPVVVEPATPALAREAELPLDPPPCKPARKPSGKITDPSKLELDDELRGIADEEDRDADRELEKFQLYYTSGLAKRIPKDCKAAFRLWLRNDYGRGERPKSKANGRESGPPMVSWTEPGTGLRMVGTEARRDEAMAGYRAQKSDPPSPEALEQQRALIEATVERLKQSEREMEASCRKNALNGALAFNSEKPDAVRH